MSVPPSLNHKPAGWRWFRSWRRRRRWRNATRGRHLADMHIDRQRVRALHDETETIPRQGDPR